MAGDANLGKRGFVLFRKHSKCNVLVVLSQCKALDDPLLLFLYTGVVVIGPGRVKWSETQDLKKTGCYVYCSF